MNTSILHPRSPQNLSKHHDARGFALIATLSLMVLVVMIALAMLSLSTIELRSSRSGKAMAEAQANARMALMMAIGELQKSTGSDTRVTAPAEIIEPSAPPLTGVWRSWEGTNHDSSTGRPIRPDYTVKTRPESDSGNFLTWLVSGAGLEQEPLVSGNKPSELVFAVPTADTIPLLSDGTLGTNLGQVHVIPQLVNDDSGALGWWVSSENQKARLIHPHNPRTDDAAGWSDLAKSHAVPDPEPFGLESLLDDPEEHIPEPNAAKVTRKAITLGTTELLADANPEKPQQSFHDLSTSSVGLLTNTATGGWRKDMSILTERWDNIYTTYSGGQLPLFRYTAIAGMTSAVPKPEINSYDPAQSSFYPWSGYYKISNNTRSPSNYFTASSSWQSLVNYATSYKKISYDSSAKTALAPFGWSTIIRAHRGQRVSNVNFYKHYHEFEINPVVARIQLVLQANAIRDPDPTRTNPELYHLINLRLVPIITLWNPHNVEISKTLTPNSIIADFGIATQRSLPITLGIINGTAPPSSGFKYKLLNGGNNRFVDGQDLAQSHDFNLQENIDLEYATGNDNEDETYLARGTLAAWLPIEFNLKPGEVKVYTPDAPGANLQHGWTTAVRLKEGFASADTSGIAVHDPAFIVPADPNTYKYLFKVPGRGENQLHLTDQLRFSIKADRFTKAYSNAITTKAGAGAYFCVGTPKWPKSLAKINAGEIPKGPSIMHSLMVANPDMDWAKEYWPSDEVDEVQYDVSELVAGGGNPPWTNIFSISFGPRLTFGAGNGNPSNRPTRGVLQSSPFVENTYSIPEQEANFHPANSAYDLSYSSMSVNSDLSPEVGTSGYIATGFQSGDGLSRLIMSEVPLRPLVSLGELQSWNIRGGNPLPPYQYNLIGNSEATPLIQQDGILPNSPLSSIVSKNLQHDDAYCANHLLFDDWFFSSIAPQPTSFDSSTGKNIETVYKNYLQGNDRLTNRAYRAILEDQKLSSGDADDRVKEILDNPAGDGWLKVASRFEVEGMFNVNSTSVKAWRALLGHARKQQVAYHSANGIELDPTQHEHVVSRHSVATDVKAGVDTGAGAIFPSGSEYSGFRTLTSSQLDELAVEIVEQVRRRGPFLSLSEFVNRQLSLDDEELALAGALQAALNSLSDNPNEALKDPGNQLSSETMDPADAKLAGVGYAFEKASEGMSTHGFPGWIRQADILRPIAPVLSARDDTFTIRAYGDARDSGGNIQARAWCEATVRRTRDFVDPQDPADSIDSPTSITNQNFGRKYIVTSFRWLKADEI